ncbi:MAG: D-alanine--D-alanine ligase [Desulfuromonadales bacterium GWD2_61_12]|nr:MAG: D-alanine--D-alanine ligase [Desulfuromonadales bacterium GWC2_61_20]OGR32791.1 MAG: D-alanine--D-alanine ligase [Desulfuromonadales bacterium GWD2_61_12]HAD04760.1 D-alanine--D-alanine ligase [Desulfuromonas sp.]HBT81907.1 D-alanine--D-alanine ligase [Desulfuromonas sp.]
MTRDELKQKTIAVLMGGLSAEREVSLRTGKAVATALTSAGYRVVPIDVSRELPAQLAGAGADVAFIALHGRFGEDGTVQGLLELLAIPYTGSGVLASSLAIDKVATKQMLLYHGLPTPAFRVYRRGEERDSFLGQCGPFPLVVKPAREGSTIGISIVRNRAELAAGFAEALRHDSTILVEEFIAGAEVTVAVIDGTVLPIIQVVPKEGFYDYTNKYTVGRTEYLLPAPLAAAVYERLQQAAVAAYRAVGCSGAARIDFMVRGAEIFCLEVNTIPGMTETSLLPKAAGHVGISFAELTQRILDGAGLSK